ncbi:hypothetical protein GCM10010967_33570 [Dyadobacter beijingensis]|uniref:Uncharacterized protein n=1 Tax=Dyadobacter beijingensis TaxID=365489 RepID=A0ABQ2I0L4_9BACT|nr:hypothetical protein GCM10010967_33570 [Dyadobacter beijingensis]
MLGSMLTGLGCFFLMAYAYAEKIGDGSWNEDIFICSLLGMFMSIGVFFLALIWLIINGILNK